MMIKQTIHMTPGGPLTVRDAANLLRAIPYRFAVTIPAATTLVSRVEVAADGTVESLAVRIYSGAELAVKVRAWIENAVQERRSLVQYMRIDSPPPGTVVKDYVDGDDDVWHFSPREPVYKDDKDNLVIEIENTDVANAYNVAVDCLIDYAGGPLPFQAVSN
jgi:hypothetical protein